MTRRRGRRRCRRPRGSCRSADTSAVRGLPGGVHRLAAALGLRLGDANVLRNAGAIVTEDVVRSLRAAGSALGVRRAVLMGHTDCAGHGGDDAAAAAALAEGARVLRGERFEVETVMYDVVSGTVTPVA